MMQAERMSYQSKPSARWLSRLAAALALLLFASHANAQGPFAALAGSWSGGGTISLSNGARESIRCRATYTVSGGGNNLQQSLRCASDSYKFELRSNVAAQGSSISGSWSEITRNLGGSVIGRIGADQIEVVVESSGFSATLTLVTQGRRQSIAIRSPGHEFSGASINLTRS